LWVRVKTWRHQYVYGESHQFGGLHTASRQIKEEKDGDSKTTSEMWWIRELEEGK
jgi:hypothetical protein